MAIADQLTPGRPVEIVFDAATGLPSANQELLLIGHAASTVAASTVNVVTVVNNVADPVAAKVEAEAKFGVGSELAKMVVAAVNANSLVGRSNFPTIKAIALASGDTGFGTSDAALAAAAQVKAEFVVSPYDGQSATLRGKLRDLAASMSGATRVENNQFGTTGVTATIAVADPSTLTLADSQFLAMPYLRDTGSGANARTQTVAELAAAYAAVCAGNVVPFNPLGGAVLGGVARPALDSDKLSIGAGLESETALAKGYAPLRVLPNGDVAIVRSVTSRRTIDGTTTVQAYFDLQDFQVLYFFRKAVYTRLSQPDFKQVKASASVAANIKSEVIRLASEFEDQQMFQAVSQLAKQVTVTRSLSDRHRFDVSIPVNVVPGLATIATTVRAGTQYDTISV
jgi:phage tail sheath gpL-like